MTDLSCKLPVFGPIKRLGYWLQPIREDHLIDELPTIGAPQSLKDDLCMALQIHVVRDNHQPSARVQASCLVG